MWRWAWSSTRACRTSSCWFPKRLHSGHCGRRGGGLSLGGAPGWSTSVPTPCPGCKLCATERWTVSQSLPLSGSCKIAGWVQNSFMVCCIQAWEETANLPLLPPRNFPRNRRWNGGHGVGARLVWFSSLTQARPPARGHCDHCEPACERACEAKLSLAEGGGGRCHSAVERPPAKGGQGCPTVSQ